MVTEIKAYKVGNALFESKEEAENHDFVYGELKVGDFVIYDPQLFFSEMKAGPFKIEEILDQNEYRKNLNIKMYPYSQKALSGYLYDGKVYICSCKPFKNKENYIAKKCFIKADLRRTKSNSQYFVYNGFIPV